MCVVPPRPQTLPLDAWKGRGTSSIFFATKTETQPFKLALLICGGFAGWTHTIRFVQKH